MDKRKEGLGEFAVACGDASKLLGTTEDTFDPVATLVDMLVEGTRVKLIGARRNHRLAALRGDCRNEGIEVVTLVSHDEFGRLILDQGGDPFDVRDLPRRKNDQQWIGQGIDCDLQLGRQSASRATDFLDTYVFLGVCRMLVGADDGRVDEQLLQIGIARQRSPDTLPDAVLAPARETDKNPVPLIPKSRWKIAPWAARTHDPQHCLDKTPIVFGRNTTISRSLPSSGCSIRSH